PSRVAPAPPIKVEAFAAAFGVKIVEGKLDGARARLKAGPKPVIRVSDRPVPLGEWRVCVPHEPRDHVFDHEAARVEALCDGAQPHRPPLAGDTRHPE